MVVKAGWRIHPRGCGCGCGCEGEFHSNLSR